MSTSSLNIRLDNQLRTQATEIFSHYGLSANQAIKLFFNQVVRTGAIPLSFDYDKHQIHYEQNPTTMQAIEDARQGKVTRCQSFDDFLNEIDHESH